MNEINFEQFIDDNDTIEVILPSGVAIELKTDLTIDERTAFIDRIAESCFVGDEKEYHPEYFEPVFEISVLQFFTDIPAFEDEDGESVDIEKTYKLCKALDIQYNVKDASFNNLVAYLKEEAYERIEFEKQILLNGERQRLEFIRSEMEEGIALINGIAESLTETLTEMTDMDDYVGELSKLNDSIQNMNEEEIVDSVLKFNKRE